MEQVRGAVIGAGTMGALYAKAFAESPLARLVAVADQEVGKARALSEQYPGINTLTSVEELVSVGGVDAVAIALPDFVHKQSVVTCLNAGIHVLCEKPLATTLKDCAEMAAAETSSAGTLMLNFGNRHRPQARLLRERILQGELGELQAVHMKGSERVSKTLMLAWRDRTDPTWFLVSHLVDFVAWMTGGSFEDVYGLGSDGRPRSSSKLTGHTSVAYLASIAGGTHAVLQSSWVLPKGYPAIGDLTFEVVGTEGLGRIEFMAGSVGMYVDGAAHLPWDFDYPDFRGHASGWWFKSCEYFLDCVLTGRTPEPGVGEGVENSLVLMAMHQSLMEGRRVEVQDWRDRYAAHDNLGAGTSA
jgi:predicted dehydrogenase